MTLEQHTQPQQKIKMPAVAALKSVRQSRNTMQDYALELTRENLFLDGTYDIFDMLSKHASEKQALERTVGATIALLKRSSKMLEDAEAKIDAQNEKLEKLEALSMHDEISALLNRRGFVKVFHKEVSRTQREQNKGGLLVMFSFENLVHIRKKHGRDAANMAVKLFSQALSSEIRECDHAGRLMDDEFVLLFTDTSMNKALNRLQNMALRLNKLSLICDGCEIGLNFSLGLKSFGKHDKALSVFEAASDDLDRNRKRTEHIKHAS